MRGAEKEEEAAGEHGIYIPPELWRHIASFVPWRHDGAAAARRVCRAFRDGVNDTAKQLLRMLPNKPTTLRHMLPPVQYPAQAYPGSLPPPSSTACPWRQVLAAVYGSCMQCGAAHWWNVTCYHPACWRVICMACRDAIDPCGGAAKLLQSRRRRLLLGACCGSCSTWYCPREGGGKFLTCRCGQEMCASCIVSCCDCGEARCSACTCDCEPAERPDARWEDDEEEEEEEDEEAEEEEDEEAEEEEEEDCLMTDG